MKIIFKGFAVALIYCFFNSEVCFILMYLWPVFYLKSFICVLLLGYYIIKEHVECKNAEISIS